MCIAISVAELVSAYPVPHNLGTAKRRHLEECTLR
jgi:hypothetical protein